MIQVNDQLRIFTTGLVGWPGVAGRTSPSSGSTSRGEFVQIRYCAVRDEEGHYQGTLEGTLEGTQDATRIRSLEGERRLLQYSR